MMCSLYSHSHVTYYYCILFIVPDIQSLILQFIRDVHFFKTLDKIKGPSSESILELAFANGLRFACCFGHLWMDSVCTACFLIKVTTLSFLYLIFNLKIISFFRLTMLVVRSRVNNSSEKFYIAIAYHSIPTVPNTTTHIPSKNFIVTVRRA